MVKLTREQRVALKRVFDRTPINSSGSALVRQSEMKYALTYREFRKTVQPGYDCVMVKWCNMWLGIERDGYTHS